MEGTQGPVNKLAQLAIEQRDGVTIARLEGEVDISNASELAGELVGALDSAGSGLVVDLSATTYVDSTGLRLLFELRRRLREGQRQLRLVVPAEAPIRRILLLTRVEDVMPIDATVDESVEQIRQG